MVATGLTTAGLLVGTFGLLVGGGGTVAAQSSPAPVSGIKTAFNGSTMPAGWQLLDSQAQKDSLFQAHPGWVTLDAMPGGMYGKYAQPVNLLAHAVNPQGNYTVTVRMRYFAAAKHFGYWAYGRSAPPGGWQYANYQGTPPYQQGDVYLYENRYNYVRVERMPSNNAIQFTVSQSSAKTNNVINEGIQTDPRAKAASDPSIYLRLVKRGTTYTGYYSFGGTHFHEIFQSTLSNFAPKYVALQAHDTGAAKHFNYSQYDTFPVGFQDFTLSAAHGNTP